MKRTKEGYYREHPEWDKTYGCSGAKEFEGEDLSNIYNFTITCIRFLLNWIFYLKIILMNSEIEEFFFNIKLAYLHNILLIATFIGLIFDKKFIVVMNLLNFTQKY